MLERLSTDLWFSLGAAELVARPSGVLYWPEAELLCASDLHLEKHERYSRQGGAALPPYDSLDTLTRLRAEITLLNPKTVISLGDSFDHPSGASSLNDTAREELAACQSGREWVWISGNHDPGYEGGAQITHKDYIRGPVAFRHIATPGAALPGDQIEISGHYHPKITVPLKGRRLTRPAFIVSGSKLIMPAFGAYTGGLSIHHRALSPLIMPDAYAILTGRRSMKIPIKAL